MTGAAIVEGARRVASGVEGTRRAGRVAAGVVAAALVWTNPADAAPERYVIDPAHFSIVFSADHIGYADTWGMFLEAEGSFTFDPEARELSDLVVTVDPASVFTNHDGRDGHLRGEDFLHVEAYPEARFVMTGAAPTGERTGTVTGDLTLRGVTRPVTLDVTWNKSGPYPFGDTYAIGISAETTSRRSDFGMTYAVENGWVGDEIPIRIDLEAIRQDD